MGYPAGARVPVVQPLAKTSPRFTADELQALADLKQALRDTCLARIELGQLPEAAQRGQRGGFLKARITRGDAKIKSARNVLDLVLLAELVP